MEFLIEVQGSKFRWRATQSGSDVATSGPKTFKTRDSCRDAARTLQNLLSEASGGLLEASGGTAPAATIQFEVQEQGRKFFWRAVDPQSKDLLAVSTQYESQEAAQAATTAFREAAPAAIVTGPTALVFTAGRLTAHWGETLTLSASSTTPFGDAAGTVWVVGADLVSQNQELSKTWSSTTIQVQLPARPAFSSIVHAIRVRSATGAEGELPILIDFDLNAEVERILRGLLDQVDVSPKAVTLEPAAPLPVDLVGFPPKSITLPTGQTVPVTASCSWRVEGAAPDQYTITDQSASHAAFTFVPEKTSDPAKTVVDRWIHAVLTLTATGYAPQSVELVAVVHVKPLLVPLRSLRDNVKLSPATTVTLAPGVPLPVDLVNLPPREILLPTGPLPITSSFDWRVEGAGGDWYRQVGKTESHAAFTFVPPPTTDPATGTVERKIVAALTLSAPGVGSESVELVLTVRVEPILLPTLVGLFTGRNLTDQADGEGRPPCVLLVVPNGTTDAVTPVVEQVRTLATLLGQIAQVFPALPWLSNLLTVNQYLPQIADSLASIAAKSAPDTNHGPKVLVGPYAAKPFFEEEKFWQVGLFSFTAEDSFSSLFMLGPGGTQVRFFNARDFNTSEGAFTLAIPENQIMAVVKDLHHYDIQPELGALGDDYVYPNWNGIKETFGDKLSSFRIGG